MLCVVVVVVVFCNWLSSELQLPLSTRSLRSSKPLCSIKHSAEWICHSEFIWKRSCVYAHQKMSHRTTFLFLKLFAFSFFSWAYQKKRCWERLRVGYENSFCFKGRVNEMPDLIQTLYFRKVGSDPNSLFFLFGDEFVKLSYTLLFVCSRDAEIPKKNQLRQLFAFSTHTNTPNSSVFT